MFSTAPREDPLESLELRDTDSNSVLVLAPGRGGMATRWSVGGREVFYLDEASLRDPTKNVRGGNPVLFPQPGKLDGDVFERDGHRGSMKQHGFARNLAWPVVRRGTEAPSASSRSELGAPEGGRREGAVRAPGATIPQGGGWTGGGASALLRLTSNDVTRASFPWDFIAEYTYILRGKLLRIEQRFTNTGAEAMPFGAGFHPYFQVKQAEKKAARVGTTATRAFDNVTKQTLPLAIDLAGSETDLHFVDHGARPCTLEWASGSIAVRGSEEFTHWVLWTVANKDFVCVEPWTCPGNALNTGDRLLVLPPGETRTLWVEIEVVR